MSLTSLGGLKAADPAKWAAKIRSAMNAAKGNRRIAAEKLGVSWRTLMRWLDDPALEDVKQLQPEKKERRS